MSVWYNRRGGIFNCSICGLNDGGFHHWHYMETKIGRKHWALIEKGLHVEPMCKNCGYGKRTMVGILCRVKNVVKSPRAGTMCNTFTPIGYGEASK